MNRRNSIRTSNFLAKSLTIRGTATSSEYLKRDVGAYRIVRPGDVCGLRQGGIECKLIVVHGSMARNQTFRIKRDKNEVLDQDR